jgi:hypothetical protein
VLAGLGHDGVGSGHDQYGTVHLGGAGDHVLDIVGVAGAVDVGIVPLDGLVLEVPGIDGNTAGLLFGRIVDFVVLHDLVAELLAAVHGDGGAQVVLPWSMWPIVPTFMWTLVRLNFSLAIRILLPGFQKRETGIRARSPHYMVFSLPDSRERRREPYPA